MNVYIFEVTEVRKKTYEVKASDIFEAEDKLYDIYDEYGTTVDHVEKLDFDLTDII